MTRLWVEASSELLATPKPVEVINKAIKSGFLEFESGEVYEIGADLKDLLVFILSAQSRLLIQTMDDLVSPEKAAQILQVSRPTIYNWQESGVLGTQPQGNRRMVPMADIERLLTAKRERAAIDDLLKESPTSEPLSAEQYRMALRKARIAGGTEAVSQVRRTQRAALARVAVKQAG
ncbi:helix-turn-helix domain protein [mine drainage metagenome]|uniref:Helix-turn-helix domain protein n=1 Tax=mine drainage metagenome TaxID=410659 RepID=A0A1J5PQC1_9ZZZZ